MASCAPKSLSSASSVDIGARKTVPEDPGRTRPELRVSATAAQTRIVSEARIRLGSWESARAFKGIIYDDISEFESFSIGAGWCQALSDYSVDLAWNVHSQGPRFSSGSALGPSHDGIRRMRRTNLPRRPCRKTYGRHKDSKRTRLIHRPCGDIAPPVGGIRVFSCRVLLCTTRCEIHERHKCALTAQALLFARSR
jgi:hypothetical protein